LTRWTEKREAFAGLERIDAFADFGVRLDALGEKFAHIEALECRL
jgi:hypothetical protein